MRTIETYRSAAARKQSESPSPTAFTTGQVAHLIGVAPRTVSKWFDSGRLKGYRLPGSTDRRIRPESLREFLAANDMPIPRQLMCGARVVYGLSLPAALPGWDVCDAFQLGELCHEKPILAAVIGDEWGVDAAAKAAAHVRKNNPDAAVVFVVDASNAAAALPGDVRVRGEVELGELMGAL